MVHLIYPANTSIYSVIYTGIVLYCAMCYLLLILLEYNIAFPLAIFATPATGRQHLRGSDYGKIHELRKPDVRHRGLAPLL